MEADEGYEWRAMLRCADCLGTYYLKGNLTVESVSDGQRTSHDCTQDDCDGTLVVEKNQHRVN
jgi:hypothetical protein